MDLPVSTWREYSAICKADGIDYLCEEKQQKRFEAWMREREALNNALNVLRNIGSHSIKSVEHIISYANRV